MSATVRAFALVYLREAELDRNKPSSIESKRQILDKHILPAIGDIAIAALTAEHISLVRERTASLSPKTANNVLCVLRKMLRLAVDFGVRQTMPQVRQLKWVRAEMTRYSPKEMARLIAGAARVSPACLAMVLLGAHGGLRRGEMLGLRWRDVDMEAGLLRVSCSVWCGKETPPKSGRSRVVPMSAALRAAVRKLPQSTEWVLERTLKKTGRGSDKNPATRATAQTIKTWMRLAQRAAQLPEVHGPHILRHTFCSALAERGAAIHVIKELAGHSSIDTTARYVHLGAHERIQAIRLLDGELG